MPGIRAAKVKENAIWAKDEKLTVTKATVADQPEEIPFYLELNRRDRS